MIDDTLSPKSLPDWLLTIYPKRYQAANNGNKPAEAQAAAGFFVPALPLPNDSMTNRDFP